MSNLFFDDDLFEIDGAMEEVEEDEKYSKKVTIPQYEPSDYCPSFSEMMDTTKYEELVTEINNTDLTPEEKRFLRLCAARHIAFNYSKVADYYANSPKKIQELLEHSAMVIIDINNALAEGFAKLDYRLVEIAKQSKEAAEETQETK